MSVSLLCHNCGDADKAAAKLNDGMEHCYDINIPQPPTRPREHGLVSYGADINMPLFRPPIRDGEVWHLRPEESNSFQRAKMTLYSNGFDVRYPAEGATECELKVLDVSWSPFSLVQACRLHSVQADAQQPWLRLFKVSVFHHGVTHFFATQGQGAETERARWVADISRALRNLTQSLFPPFCLRAEPLPGAGWTAMRLLAGYLLLCDDRGVSLVYCELHAHWDDAAAFVAYEDEYCDIQVLRLSVDKDTCVSERVGIDCSCFSLGGHHVSTRSCAEKVLWLRAISNVKVKLRHGSSNPTPTDLKHYRSSVLEHVQGVKGNVVAEFQPDAKKPLLPIRSWRRSVLPGAAAATDGPDGPDDADGVDSTPSTPSSCEAAIPRGMNPGRSKAAAACPIGPSGSGPSWSGIANGLASGISCPTGVPPFALSTPALEMGSDSGPPAFDCGALAATLPPPPALSAVADLPPPPEAVDLPPPPDMVDSAELPPPPMIASSSQTDKHSGGEDSAMEVSTGCSLEPAGEADAAAGAEMPAAVMKVSKVPEWGPPVLRQAVSLPLTHLLIDDEDFVPLTRKTSLPLSLSGAGIRMS